MKKILVLEDDPYSLLLMHEILEKYDFCVVDSSDGLDALEVAKTEHPNLAIVDIRLPTLNGYQVCERLRNMPETKNIPIIVLTVLNEDQHRIRAIEAGANDFISKPFKSVELITKIKSLLSQQEKIDGAVSFENFADCLIKALKYRNPRACLQGRRVSYMAEQLGLAHGLAFSDISNMKRGILLQDIGQLAMDKDTQDFSNQKYTHAQLGAEMLSTFDWPIVKEVVLYHHCDLKSNYYLNNLSEQLQEIIGIVTICNRVDQLYYSDSKLPTEQVFTMLKAETEKGLWDRADFDLICQITDNGKLLGSR